MSRTGQRTYRHRYQWRVKLRQQVGDRDGWRCRRCGIPAGVLKRGRSSLLLSHVIPRRLGGPDTPDNLVMLCARCSGETDGGRRYG